MSAPLSQKTRQRIATAYQTLQHKMRDIKGKQRDTVKRLSSQIDQKHIARIKQKIGIR